MTIEQTITKSWCTTDDPFPDIRRGTTDEDKILHFYNLNKNMVGISSALVSIKENIALLVDKIKHATTPSVVVNVTIKKKILVEEVTEEVQADEVSKTDNQTNLKPKNLKEKKTVPIKTLESKLVDPPTREEFETRVTNRVASVPIEMTDKIAKTIESIKPTFNKVSNEFQALMPELTSIKQVANDLQTVIKFSLPEYVNKVERSKVSPLKDPSLSDEGYAAQLMKACKTSSVIGRLTVYAGIVSVLNEGIKDLVNKWDKLDQRIFLTPEQDRDKPEVKIVRNKMQAVKDSIEVLNRRREDVLNSFFECRKKILQQIADLSRKLFATFDKDEKNVIDNAAHAFDIRDMLTELANEDDKAHREAIAMSAWKRKGSNRVGGTQLRRRVHVEKVDPKTGKKRSYTQKMIK